MYFTSSTTRFLYVKVMGRYKPRLCRLKVIFFFFICLFCHCGGADCRERKFKHPCHKAVVVVGMVLLCSDFSGDIDYCRLDVSYIECSSTFLRVVRQCNRLLRGIVNAPSLDVFTARLNGTLSNLV